MRKISENSVLEREKIFSKNREKIAKNETRNAKIERRLYTNRRPPTANRPTRSANQTDGTGRPPTRSTRCKGYKTVTRLQNGNRGYKTVTKRCKGVDLYGRQDTVNLFSPTVYNAFLNFSPAVKCLFFVLGGIFYILRDFSAIFPG